MSQLRCPNCGHSLPRTTSRESSGILACTHCHKAFRIRHKRQPVAKIKDVLPADTSHTDLESAEYERLDVLPGEQQLLDVEPVPEVAVAVQPVAEVIAVPAQVSAPIAEPWNPPTVPEPVSEAPAKPSQKIAFTPATGRPPINWMLAFSCIFVSGAVATFLSLPAMLLEADGKTGLGVSLLYVAAFLGGAIFAGFFASAI